MEEGTRDVQRDSEMLISKKGWKIEDYRRNTDVIG